MQLQDLVGQPVAIYPGFKVLGAGLTGTSFLSQAVYWTERTSNGWFYKSRDEWEAETGLSRSEQELARKKLVAIGVLEEARKGIPCRLHFRVDTDALMAILSDEVLQASAQETCNQVGRKPANKEDENTPTSGHETFQLACGEAADRPAENLPAITEITQETTQEITSKTTSAVVAKAPKSRAKKSGDAEAEAQRQAICREIWKSYSKAYEARYSVSPVRNAKVNRQVVELWKRLGAEASGVAAYFLTINDSFLIRNFHDMGSLLAKAEAYRTQWATNRQMNATTARQIEQTQANLNAAQQAVQNINDRQEGGSNAFL